MSDSYKIYASQDYVDSKGLPEGTSANQQLVTDKDGVVKWEVFPFRIWRGYNMGWRHDGQRDICS